MRPTLKRVSWGIEIRSLARDETLYTHDAEKLLLPASNEKVMRSPPRRDVGWDFTFTTELSAVGPVDGGVLTATS